MSERGMDARREVKRKAMEDAMRDFEAQGGKIPSAFLPSMRAAVEKPEQESQGAEMEARAQKRVGAEQLRKANETLKKYKAGKSNLERRLIEDEKYWNGMAWDAMRERGNPKNAKRPTNWLFNVIMGKHADMMEAYPEPVILPREQGDEEEAKRLTSILPVVLEQNYFEDTYSMQAWEKNKHGTGCYAIYWDKSKLNGMGDISICGVDLVNLYWEPGIEDIQKSKNVFFACLQDKDELIQQYPQLQGKNLQSDFTVQKYKTEDLVDTSGKALVIDWYYHTFSEGRRLLQYCKYCGQEVLYASEDDPQLQGEGWYDDGNYPFVIDALFPQKGSIAGNGYIDLGKNAQESINLLDQAVTMNALSGSIPRYLVTEDTGINEEEFLDFRKPFVHVQGSLNENHYQPMVTRPLGGIYVQVMNNKIEELKQTCGNQDVTNGITSGVTAASGIAAQMEAAGRSSRDGNRGTYRAYSKILEMVIERMRQFYDVPREFRILGQNAQAQFVQYDNAGLKNQPQMPIAGMDMGMRKPVFDIQVSAQKQNAYTKMAQNELALQLLSAGVFNAQMADQSAMLLSMMDFPKKDELLQKVQENVQLVRMMAMWQQMALELATKYEPELAEQMANDVMAGAGIQDGGGGSPIKIPENKKTEDKRMTKARERSRSVSQVQ